MSINFFTHKFTAIAMLAFLSLAGASCGVMREAEGNTSGMPSTSSTRVMGAVHRNSGNHDRSWARTEPKPEAQPSDDYQPIMSIPATSDKWKITSLQVDASDNQALYQEIKSWLGTPYAGGGHTKHVGTDCSGFVMEIYLTVYGMQLERRGSLMYSNNCVAINKSQLSEGDLVFFHDGSGTRISHVGIYLKDNKFAHASSSRGVIIDDLGSDYYLRHYYGAGRIKR